MDNKLEELRKRYFKTLAKAEASIQEDDYPRGYKAALTRTHKKIEAHILQQGGTWQDVIKAITPDNPEEIYAKNNEIKGDWK
jgi:hypothetical protein